MMLEVAIKVLKELLNGMSNSTYWFEQFGTAQSELPPQNDDLPF